MSVFQQIPQKQVTKQNPRMCFKTPETHQHVISVPKLNSPLHPFWSNLDHFDIQSIRTRLNHLQISLQQMQEEIWSLLISGTSSYRTLILTALRLLLIQSAGCIKLKVDSLIAIIDNERLRPDNEHLLLSLNGH